MISSFYIVQNQIIFVDAINSCSNRKSSIFTCYDDSSRVVFKKSLILMNSRKIISHLKLCDIPNTFYWILIVADKIYYVFYLPRSVNHMKRTFVFPSLVQTKFQLKLLMNEGNILYFKHARLTTGHGRWTNRNFIAKHYTWLLFYTLLLSRRQTYQVKAIIWVFM